MIVGIVLADVAIESVGVDAANQQHGVENHQVQHGLDDLDLIGLAGLPVDCPTPQTDARVS